MHSSEDAFSMWKEVVFGIITSWCHMQYDD